VKNKFLSSAVVSATTGLLVSSLGFVFAAPARADFNLCNSAQTKYLAAASYNTGNGIISFGWIQLQPGQCSLLFTGSAANHDIALYGENIGGGFTTGSTRRCVIQFPTQASWNITGADDASRCRGRGRVI
jgi:uncharacterized membrane protein